MNDGYKTDCISGESIDSAYIQTGEHIPTTYDHTDIQSRYRLDKYGIQHLPRDRGKVYTCKVV